MADATPFAITAVVDAGAKPGYKESVCVSCSTAAQTKTTELTVQQSSRCLETITSVEGEKMIRLDLDPAATEMTTLSQWDFAKMFVNSDKDNCPISQCTLKTAGCKADYTGGNIKLVKGADGFTAQANTNVELGFKEQVCISCTNDFQTVDQDGYTVHQRGICDNSLEASGLDVAKEQTGYLDTADKKYYPQGWEYFIKNTQMAKCPITACTLKTAGCKEPYTGDGVVIGSKPDFVIGYKQNVIQGYQDNVCLSCTNGVQTADKDGLSFEQTSKCASSLSAADSVLPA